MVPAGSSAPVRAASRYKESQTVVMSPVSALQERLSIQLPGFVHFLNQMRGQ